MKKIIPFIFVFLFTINLNAQDIDDLEESPDEDLESMLQDVENTSNQNKEVQGKDLILSGKEEKDDLESLKEDLGDIILEDPLEEAVKT